MSRNYPRPLNITPPGNETRFNSPKLLSIEGIELGEPEIIKKYAWNYQNITKPPTPPAVIKEDDGINDKEAPGAEDPAATSEKPASGLKLMSLGVKDDPPPPNYTGIYISYEHKYVERCELLVVIVPL